MDDVAHERPASPPLSPSPAPAPIQAGQLHAFNDHIEELEHRLYDQAHWIHQNLPIVLADIRDLQENMGSLRSRIEEMEGYMGFSPQPVVLYNGAGEMHYFTAGPSYRRRYGREVDSEERDPTVALWESRWERAAEDEHKGRLEEDGRGTTPIPTPIPAPTPAPTPTPAAAPTAAP